MIFMLLFCSTAFSTPDDNTHLSLNLHQVPVQSVLSLLSKLSHTNMVISNAVTGNINLKLTNMPWQEVLDIILQTQQLDQLKIGHTLWIAPATDILQQKEQAAKAYIASENSAPMAAQFILLKYAKAKDMAELVQSKSNAMLSKRGSISFDARSNQVWVQDTVTHLPVVCRFIQQLDIPVRQVLIEARIVEINQNHETDLGARLGITHQNPNQTLPADLSLKDTANPAYLNMDLSNHHTFFNSTSQGNAATLGISLGTLGKNTFLDLELSALESQGEGKIVSAPRVLTANEQTARIESGEEIPYQESTSSGATAVAFKKAVLSLEVTPQITADNQIMMTLQVHKDSRGTANTASVTGEPAINTRSVKTNVLVENHQTIVLGGIYDQNQSETITKTPFLGDLPLIGYAFKQKQHITNRSELLIFITPKIVPYQFENEVEIIVVAL